MTEKAAKETIGVVGRGFVGTVIADYYAEHGHGVKSYDIRGDCDPIEVVGTQDVVFIAIMLPRNGTSAEERNALSSILHQVSPRTIAVIKSTVVPGTTDILQAKHPDKCLCFVPEFLTEATATDDFAYPEFQLIGTTEISDRAEVARTLLRLLPKAHLMQVVTATTAEMFKSIRNSYMALKLIAFNQIYDVCEEAGVSYETMRDVLAGDPWIGDSHNVIWHKGKRGFSGKCLPKDLDGLLTYCEKRGVPLPLFEMARKLNEKYLKEKRE